MRPFEHFCIFNNRHAAHLLGMANNSEYQSWLLGKETARAELLNDLFL